MDGNTAIIAATAIITGSGLIIGIVSMGTRAWQRVVTIQNQGRYGSEQLTQEVQSLKKEVAQLRDTTTRYDLPFDTALQRMESRIENLEGKSLADQKGRNEEALSAKVGN